MMLCITTANLSEMRGALTTPSSEQIGVATLPEGQMQQVTKTGKPFIGSHVPRRGLAPLYVPSLQWFIPTKDVWVRIVSFSGLAKNLAYRALIPKYCPELGSYRSGSIVIRD